MVNKATHTQSKPDRKKTIDTPDKPLVVNMSKVAHSQYDNFCSESTRLQKDKLGKGQD